MAQKHVTRSSGAQGQADGAGIMGSNTETVSNTGPKDWTEVKIVQNLPNLDLQHFK